MRTLPVELPGREYKIEIGAGNLRDSLLSAIRQFDPERVVTVTNSTLEQFYPAQIKKLLEEMFYDTLNVEFNLTAWTRNLVKYGDFFLFNDVSPEYGVINAFPLPISEVEREEGFDPKGFYPNGEKLKTKAGSLSLLIHQVSFHRLFVHIISHYSYQMKRHQIQIQLFLINHP